MSVSTDPPQKFSWFWSFLLNYYKIKKKWKIHQIYLLKKIWKLGGGQYLLMKHFFFAFFFEKNVLPVTVNSFLFCFFGKNTFFNGFYSLQMFKIINFLSFFHKKFVFFVLESIDKTSNFFYFCVFCAKIVLFLHTIIHRNNTPM